jgi:ABC-2 type transport system ATP-binding protein
MLFHLRRLSYQYRERDAFSLGPLSLQFDSSWVNALIGANGSGKTTLIRILLCQLLNYEGEYRIDDYRVIDRRGELLSRFGIGYAPENPVLDESLTGADIAKLVCDIGNYDQERFSATMQECTDKLALDQWFYKKPCREYSQGMRRKVALVIALLQGTRFLILDEPTNGLDPLAVYGMKQLVLSRAQRGVGALVSSHILDMVEKVAGNIIMLKKGQTLYSGSLDALIKNHPAFSLDDIYFALMSEKGVARTKENESRNN